MADPIKFVEDDPAVILPQVIADYQQIANRTLGNADPEMLLINAFAYRAALLMGQVNYTGNQNLIGFSTGAALEQLGIKSGTFRLPASAALVTMQYTVGSGAGAFVLAAGSRTKSQDGKVLFATIADTNISGPGTFDIDCICLTAGAVGNGYTAGTINIIVDPVAYVTAAVNTDTSTGGADAETDDQLRARIPLANATYSVAGPEDAYIFYAKSASSSIVDVSIVPTLLTGAISANALNAGGSGYAVGDQFTVNGGTHLATGQVLTEAAGVVTAYVMLTRGSGYSTGTGVATTATSGSGTGLTIDITSVMPAQTICIYPLLAGGVVPDGALLNLVEATCSDKKVRPLTDVVLGIAPSNVDYSLTVNLTLKKGAPANVVATVYANLSGFVNQWSKALGVDIIVNQMIGQCMVPGVYTVAIPSLSGDISIDDTEFGNCTGITVNVVSIVDEL